MFDDVPLRIGKLGLELSDMHGAKNEGAICSVVNNGILEHPDGITFK